MSKQKFSGNDRSFKRRKKKHSKVTFEVLKHSLSCWSDVREERICSVRLQVTHTFAASILGILCSIPQNPFVLSIIPMSSKQGASIKNPSEWMSDAFFLTIGSSKRAL